MTSFQLPQILEGFNETQNNRTESCNLDVWEVFAKVTHTQLLRQTGASEAEGTFCQPCKPHEEAGREGAGCGGAAEGQAGSPGALHRPGCAGAWGDGHAVHTRHRHQFISIGQH